ncbi:hypothetical protein Fot_07010 [Forsythia ovata]|uniref:Uncharacterized protein n=1 Tax=Forsythia ovata TaxID=205694 RepID=A0ABD1WUL6_9LAMI
MDDTYSKDLGPPPKPLDFISTKGGLPSANNLHPTTGPKPSKNATTASKQPSTAAALGFNPGATTQLGGFHAGGPHPMSSPTLGDPNHALGVETKVTDGSRQPQDPCEIGTYCGSIGRSHLIGPPMLDPTDAGHSIPTSGGHPIDSIPVGSKHPPQPAHEAQEDIETYENAKDCDNHIGQPLLQHG